MGDVGSMTPKIRKKARNIHHEWANFELTFVLKERSELENMDPKRLTKTPCVFLDTRGYSINKRYSQKVIETFDKLCDKINYSYSNTEEVNLQKEFGFYATIIRGKETPSTGKRLENYEWKEVIRKKSHNHVNFASNIDVRTIYRNKNYNLELYLERMFMTIAHHRKLIN